MLHQCEETIDDVSGLPRFNARNVNYRFFRFTRRSITPIKYQLTTNCFATEADAVLVVPFRTGYTLNFKPAWRSSHLNGGNFSVNRAVIETAEILS